MQSRLDKAGWRLLDLLFPPCCAGCGKWGERYCQACFDAVNRIDINLCQRCGEPLSFQDSLVCSRCQNGEAYFSVVRSWALFEEPLNRAIHQLKYKKNIGLGEVLAQPLIGLLERGGWKIDLVTAVPLDPERFKIRGYNQAALLARPLAWHFGIPFSDQVLVRDRPSRPQVGLSQEERAQNIRGVFRAEPSLASGKNILIVDDVITTGSTMNECSKVLKEKGAKEVFGLTLARSAQR